MDHCRFGVSRLNTRAEDDRPEDCIPCALGSQVRVFLPSSLCHPDQDRAQRQEYHAELSGRPPRPAGDGGTAALRRLHAELMLVLGDKKR